MNAMDHFHIEQGTLTAYTGTAAHAVIPQGVTCIGKNAFAGHEELQQVDIPSTVTRIDSGAFHDCTGLRSVVLPSSLTSMGVNHWSYDFWMCESWMADDEPECETGVFSGCSSLQSAVLPDGLEELCDYTFYRCTALQSISIPASMKRIGCCAFHGCTVLEEVDILGQDVKIGEEAFFHCTALRHINGGFMPEHDAVRLFNGCEGLMDEQGLVCIGHTLYNCRDDVKHIAIPDTVTAIAGKGLMGCKVLTAVTLPPQVKQVGQGAFCVCKVLRTVTILAEEVQLGYSVFEGAEKLHTVYAGPKVRRLLKEQAQLPKDCRVLPLFMRALDRTQA